MRNPSSITESSPDPASRPNLSSGLVLKKLQRNWLDYGFWTTLRKSLARTVLFPFYERTVYRIYRADLDSIRPARGGAPEGLEFRVLRPEDDSFIRQIERQAEWLEGTLRWRITGRGACLAALYGEQVVGFNLIAFGEAFIPLVHVKRVFRAHEAWSEHLAVRNDFRRKGIASFLRYRIFEELRRFGVKKLYGGSRCSNLPALELARKIGFVEVADLEYVRVLHSRTWRCHRVGRLVLPDHHSFSSEERMNRKRRHFLLNHIRSGGHFAGIIPHPPGPSGHPPA